MGQSSSIPGIEPLQRLSSGEPVMHDDVELWDELFTVSLPSQSAEDLAAASYEFCAEMARNNAQSGNFQALLRRLLDLLGQACKPNAAPIFVRQSCGCIFLMRLFLKHMVETLDPGEIEPHLCVVDHSGRSTSLAAPLMETLLSTLSAFELTDETYWLHMECIAALLVGASTQLHTDLAEPAPHPFLRPLLTSESPSAEALVVRLLGHIVSRPPPPQQPRSMLRTLGSAAGFVLLLPYHALRVPFSYLSAAFYASDSASGDAAPMLSLAERSVSLLLVLTQHLPPALFPPEYGPPPENPFLNALRAVGDMSPFTDADADADADADPEGGMLRSSRMPFVELHDSIAARLPEEGATLLLYLLLHGNQDYLEYCLSRTDPERLLVPLLRALHDSRQLSANQLYMLLIILLILSQDVGYMRASQKSLLPSVPWFEERLLGVTSLGSLIVIILVRTVQTNLASGHDAYVSTNCLAALANMAPHLRNVHPYAARSLLAVNDIFCRKYLKRLRAATESTCKPQPPVGRAAEPLDPSIVAVASQGGEDEETDELQVLSDFLRISLEIVNLALAAGPTLNEHLVYVLLERQTLFTPLRKNAPFADLVANIEQVAEHFGATLRVQPTSNNDATPAVLSVDTVLSHIRGAGRDWRAERLRPLPDLKFTYEQEAAPEEFFTPYIWAVVLQRTALGWDFECVVLFQPGGAAEEECDEDTPALPPLTSVDVDEAAVVSDAPHSEPQ